MNTYITSNRLIKTALVTAMLAVGCAAMAQKPEWAGGQGKGKHSAPAAQAAPQPAAASSKAVPPAVLILPGEYFTEAQRRAILDYYASQQQRTKRCPPGLAKKNNGCMPPGQAKKWAMGQPLPSGVIYQPLPDEIFRRIGLPPRELEIVRILNDILVLRRGSRLVLDAVEILGQP